VPPRGRLLILEREKPADLLVQAPNKYALALNLKWAEGASFNGTQRRGVPGTGLANSWQVVQKP
jgi:hypothetical protein